jgi:hypothetical protein
MGEGVEEEEEDPEVLEDLEDPEDPTAPRDESIVVFPNLSQTQMSVVQLRY